MRIIDETGKSKGPYISIVDVKYIEDYRLLITFDDGLLRLVDFGEFLRTARHPDIRKYLDIKNFKKFKIVYGDLEWPNLELVFPIIELYRGHIELGLTNKNGKKLPISKSKSIPNERRKLSKSQHASRTA